MISNKKRKTIIFLLISLLFVLIFTSFCPIEMDLNKNTKFNDRGLPKTSAIYNLTGQTIYIDDTDPNNNWSKTAADNIWCVDQYGDGTYYVIAEVLIDGQNSAHLIDIKNSRVDFTITGCELYNDYSWVSCIHLENVTNGIIYDNDCYSYQYWSTDGIKLYDSSENFISDNYIQDSEDGITLSGDCDKNDLSRNEIQDCEDYGIYIGTDSSNNTVDKNMISSNRELYERCHYGIYIEGVENNITRNIITSTRYEGIKSEGGSTYIAQNDISEVVGGIFSYDSYGDIIYNNTVHDVFNPTNPGYFGIRALSGGGHKIIKNTIERISEAGIILENSDNNDVIDNVIDSCIHAGIYLGNSQNFNISNNVVTNVTEFGMSLVNSESGEVSDNNLYGSGYNVDGDVASMTSLDMDTSNLVNDKPLYFYEGTVGINNAMVSNAGQIICYSCIGIDISNLIFKSCSLGTAFYHCSILDLANIQSSLNNIQGIKAISCNFTEIVGSNFSNNALGMLFSDCRDLVINDCIVNSNADDGINVQGTEIEISDCTITYNIGNGIYSEGDGIINDNTINRNEINGILLFDSSKMYVSSNSLTYNWISGIEAASCNNCTILGNTASHNADYGIFLSHSSYCYVAENTCSFNLNSSERYDFHTVGIFIKGDYIPHFSGYTSYGNRIIGNTLSDQDESMVIEHSYNDTVANNILDHQVNLWRVYALNFSKNSMIFEFNPVMSGHPGMYMRESHNLTVNYNTLQHCGFSMEECDNNTFISNTLYDSSIAFDFEDSSYNKIINNTILRAGQCFREQGNCVGNVFIGNICEGLLLPLRELGALIGVIAVAAVTGLMYFKRRKYMRK